MSVMRAHVLFCKVWMLALLFSFRFLGAVQEM
jgi:hypothetical protein